MNNKTKIYIILSLLITWGLTFFLYANDKLLVNVSYIMFVPAITALVVRISTEGFTVNIFKNPQRRGILDFFKAIIFSILFVIAFVSIIAFAGALIYNNKIDNNFINGLYSSEKLTKVLFIAALEISAALALSFSFCYCYFISNGVYPCVLMHGFWNVFNPYVLGSIYIGMKGAVLTDANVLMANGEGVFGVILGVILIPLFIFLIRRTEKRDQKIDVN